jgi:hypothetical protein
VDALAAGCHGAKCPVLQLVRFALAMHRLALQVYINISFHITAMLLHDGPWLRGVVGCWGDMVGGEMRLFGGPWTPLKSGIF